MGTWKLVQCPEDAIPIANKWVLTRKWASSKNIRHGWLPKVSHKEADLIIHISDGKVQFSSVWFGQLPELQTKLSVQVQNGLVQVWGRFEP